MSFSSLLSGAECSTSANPLAQFSKHAAQDTSLQRDRMVGGQQAQRPGGMRSAQAPMTAQDGKLMEDMFNAGPVEQETFRFEGMRKQLNGIHRTGPPPNWSAEFGNAPQSERGAWNVREFEERARLEASFKQKPNAQGQDPAWQREFMASSGSPMLEQHQTGYHASMPYQPMFAGRMGLPMTSFQEPMMTDVKGKGRMIELDPHNWEEHFKAIENLDNADKEKLEKFQEEQQVKAIEDEGQALHDESQYFGDFESLWKGIQQDHQENGMPNHLDWESELANFPEDGPMMSTVPQSFTPDGKPNLGEYLFEPDNVYLNHADPFGEGMALMDQGGSLSEAALAFEAACQKDLKRSEAWAWLGFAQAQNEKEEPAIRALDRATKLDPANLQALLALAVSYTNEGYDTASYLTLEQWITTKYPQLAPSTPPAMTNNRFQVHERVTELFLRAARQSPNGAEMDADVQVGLGVLFYGDEDFDKAVDCFVTALRTRPDDHLLWNRLGATLANSGRSEEAIEAYQKALEYRPGFVRARYNLGVSCINIGCYTEAAQHLLRALAMHQVDGDAGGGVNISSNLWETLRRVFLVSLNRPDLAEKAVSGADISIFRDEFEF
ncbi:TPR-like protein [Saitoella complicata NRRL Y-17804]|uniref:TPR-like protein n=1 Tax=Saitoella complicata (strain BCRC 22490 / CBS 7301 / JCM 7358 / NBRC 10748 / NRRL Y-17804) TaxID=698492 RepID=UPI000867C34F|nr:TPR-like protein [Saitoella complicata NRRL Y-17804]ODQ55466.1 TPR-like protein [Saitoella complicata NRRL Y-17804]